MPKATKVVPTFPGKKVGDTMLALGEATRDHDDQGKHNVDVIAGIENLISDDDMDKEDYMKALAMYKAGDMAGLRDHIYDLDTVPREALMMMIGKSDRRAFDYMYPKAKSGDYMSSISFDHGHSRNKDKDDKFLSYIEPGTVMSEDDVDEGNAFTDALRKAKEAGESEFEVDGKKYKVEEDELETIKKLAQVDEAVLKDRDYKAWTNDKGEIDYITMTKKMYRKVPKDRKMEHNGTPMMMALDDVLGTVMVPVRFVNKDPK